jgi:hypothetical protein
MSICEICGREIADGTTPGHISYRDCGERSMETSYATVCTFCVLAVKKVVNRRREKGAKYRDDTSKIRPCLCVGGEPTGFDGAMCKYFHGRKVTATCICGLRVTEIDEGRCNKTCKHYTEFKPIPGRPNRHV